MREMRIAECGLRNCRSPVATRTRPGLKPFGNSAFRNPHSAFPDVLGLVSSLLAIPHFAFRISPTSLLAGRNFEPGAVGFQSAPMSGFIKSQIR
jgi:hypothetical protein